MEGQSHVQSYRGFVVVATHVLGKDQENSVKVLTYRYTTSTKTFNKYKAKSFSLGITGRNIKVVTFECILEESTGIRQPCLVVEQLRKRGKRSSKDVPASFIYHCLFLVNLNSLVNVGCFQLDYSIQAFGFKLCDGPCICWSYKDSVHFAKSTQNSLVFKLSSYKVSTVSDKELNILWCGSMSDRLIVMGTEKNDMCQSLMKWICIDYHLGVIASDRTIPSAYAAVVTCCSVVSNDNVCHHSEGYDDYTILAGTSMGQLIEFTQGKLTNYCQIPFDDPVHIKTIEVDPCSSLILVQSDSKKACVVSIKHNKVKECWESAQVIIVDDFLEKGTDQVLVLDEGVDVAGPDTLTSYVLTDLCGLTISSDQASCVSSSPDGRHSESLQKTAQALKTRLQVSMSQLTEARMECEEKQRVVEHTCGVLHSIAMDQSDNSTYLYNSPVQKSPGMVCLLEGKVDEENQHKSLQSRAHTLDVVATWQRVVGDNWVIGIELQNKGTSMVSDLCLALVSCRGEMMTSSCNTVLETTNPRLTRNPLAVKDAIVKMDVVKGTEEKWSAAPPSNKRRKMTKMTVPSVVDVHADELDQSEPKLLFSGQSTNVVVVSPLPQFIRHDRYSCSLALTWTSYPEGGGLRRQAMCCGYVSLSACQVLDGTLTISKKTGPEAAKRDVLAVNAVSLETKLLLKSTISTLCHIVSMLRGGLGLASGAVCDVTSRDPDSYLLRAEDLCGPLRGSAMLIHPENRQANVQLFTRNRNQVYLILHRLRHILPDDVTMEVDPSVNDTPLCKAVHCLQHELATLNMGLREIINNDTVSSDGALDLRLEDRSDATREDKLKGIRKEFERKRESGNTSKERVVRQQGATLWTNVIDSETLTNNAMAKILDLGTC